MFLFNKDTKKQFKMVKDGLIQVALNLRFYAQLAVTDGLELS